MGALDLLSIGSSEDQAGNNNPGEMEAGVPKEDSGENSEEEEEEEVEERKLLLFYVELSSEERKEVAIVQLGDLRKAAPDQLLKFLESNIDIKSDGDEEEEEEYDFNDVRSQDMGSV